MGRFNFEAYNAEIAEKKLQQKRPRVKTFVPFGEYECYSFILPVE